VSIANFGIILPELLHEAAMTTVIERLNGNIYKLRLHGVITNKSQHHDAEQNI
jgi:hypothetical protein